MTIPAEDYYAVSSKPATYTLVTAVILLLCAIGLIFVLTANISPEISATSATFAALAACFLLWRLYTLSQKKDFASVRKIGDVIVGVLLTVFGGMILNFFVGYLALGFLGNSGLPAALLIGIGVPLLAVLLLVRLFHSIGRRFIAYGVLGSAVIPLLIFGACLYALRVI